MALMMVTYDTLKMMTVIMIKKGEEEENQQRKQRSAKIPTERKQTRRNPNAISSVCATDALLRRGFADDAIRTPFAGHTHGRGA